MQRRHRLVVATAALIIPFAACGSDDSTGPAEEFDGESSVEESTDEASQESDQQSDQEAAGDEVSNAQWCSGAELVNELADALDDAIFDPTALEAGVREYREAIAALSDLVPAEVRDAYTTLSAGVDTLDEVLAAADYDLLDADLSRMDAISGEMDDGSDRMRAFNQRTCGFEPPENADDADDDAFDPALGTARDQIARDLAAGGFTEDEARCIAENIEISDFAADEFDDRQLDAMLAVFATCEIPLERFDEMDG